MDGDLDRMKHLRDDDDANALLHNSDVAAIPIHGPLAPHTPSERENKQTFRTHRLIIGPSSPNPTVQGHCWLWINRMRRAKGGVIFVVALALFTDMVIYDAIIPILPLLLKNVGKDESYMGLLFAIYAIGFLIATPLSGIWSDRNKNRKLPMILGQAALAISTVLFALAKQFWLLLLARALQGIAAAVSWTLGLALLADAVPPEELGSAMGIVFGFNTLGFLLGPLLGGVLTQLISLQAPFLIWALLCIIDLVARALILPPSPREQPGINLTILNLLLNPEIILVGIVVAISTGAFSALETLLSAYMQSTFGLDVMGVSFAMMAIIVPCVLFSFLAGWWADRHCRYQMILAGMILWVIAQPLMGWSPQLWSFLVASAFFGATASILQAPTLPQMASIVGRIGGSGLYAQAYAIFNICFSLGMLVAPLAAAYLNEHVGFFWTMVLVSSPFLLLIPPFIWLAIRRGGVAPQRIQAQEATAIDPEDGIGSAAELDGDLKLGDVTIRVNNIGN